MKIVTNKDYNLGLYEKALPNSLSIREKLAEMKAAGFDFMEISIDESDEKLERLKWSKKQKNDLVATTWDTDTKIITMCLSGHRKYPIGSEELKIRTKGMEIMSDAICFAADTGIRIIQIAGYDVYYNSSNENTRKYFLNNLKICVELASRSGVILAFETMETEFLDTIEKAMEYIKAINSPYLQIYPDLGNITNAAVLYRNNLMEDLMKGNGHIVALHLKDTSPGKYRDIPFGSGHVDFNNAINFTQKMGVRIFLAEFWHTGDYDWKSELRNINHFIRSQFDVNNNEHD